MSEHHHQSVADEASQRRDPTGTAPIRRQFDKEVKARFNSLRAMTRRVVVDLDVLGLRGVTVDNLQFAKLYGQEQRALTVSADSLPEKGRAFGAWLSEAYANTVLGSWSDPFVMKAYGKGVTDGLHRIALIEKKLAVKDSEGDWQGRHLHKQTYISISTRSRDSLRTICETMATQIIQTMSQGVIEQRQPEAIATDMLAIIDKVGINRGRLVASCDTISAYNEAAINVYDEAGVQFVGVIPEVIPGHQHHQHVEVRDARRSRKGVSRAPKPDYGPEIYKRGSKRGEPKPTESWPRGRWPKVEWVTAGDDYVCPQCEALDGQVFTLHTARGMFPLHPNCRCALFPLEEDDL